MAIRFYCSGCDHMLEVPAETAGKQARCPKCGIVASIPTVSEQSEPPSLGSKQDDSPYGLKPESLETKPTGSENPYMSPALSEEPSFAYEDHSGSSNPIRPTQIDFGTLFNESWRIYQQEMGMVIGVCLVVIFTGQGLNYVGEMITTAIGPDDFPVLVFSVLFQIGSWVLMRFLGIGQAIVLLRIAKGQKSEFGEMFSGGKYLLRSLGADILIGLALLVSFSLLIIPGIYVSLLLWPYYLVIVDRDTGVFDSFSIAQRITEGNKLTMLGVWFTCVGIVILGVIALCVGYFFAAPFVSLTFVVAYVMMSGQYRGNSAMKRSLPEQISFPAQ